MKASTRPTSVDPFAAPHWNSWGANQQNTRFQPAAMAGLDKAGVGKLELQWAFAFPGETLAEAHASVVDGRLFVGSRSGDVYALDAKSGCTHWTFRANAAVKGAMLVAMLPGRKTPLVFFGDVSGRAYALDAAAADRAALMKAAVARSLGIEVSFCGTRGHGGSSNLRWG